MRAAKAFVNMVVNERVWGWGGGGRKERRGSRCGVRRTDEGPAQRTRLLCVGGRWRLPLGGSLGASWMTQADM